MPHEGHSRRAAADANELAEHEETAGDGPTGSEPSLTGVATEVASRENGPSRYAFAAPQEQPNVAFKRTRRAPAAEPTQPAERVRPLRRRVFPIVIAAVCVLALIPGWVVVVGWQASDHLANAARLLTDLQHRLEQGDFRSAKGVLTALQRETSAARSDTADPGWRLATGLPWLGDDFRAVDTVAVTLDELSHRGLPSLVDTAASVDIAKLVPQQGRIDFAPLERVVPRLATAYTAVKRARDRVAAIPVEGLAPEIKAAVAKLDAGLGRATQATGTALRTAQLLPPMLGAHGPRTYLLLFQNPAEVRATGGMPGAYVVLEANQGAIRIVDQGAAAADLKQFPSPVLPLAPELEALYTDRIGMFPADINLTPDFPTAAELGREMYRRRSGRTVDGVLATDPVGLSYLLRATGPLPMPAGPPLAADSVVRLLLSQTYATMTSPAQKDQYFATVARATFEALTQRPGNVRAVLAALARAAGERRILVWSAHPEDQQNIAGTVLEGALPPDDGASPTVGVFLNDGSGAKLGYYLTHGATLGVGGCRTDGRRELRLRVTVGSTAPTSGLPAYVLGLALAGDPYTIRTNVMVFSPTGGGVVQARLDGATVPLGSGVERYRGVGVLTVDLPPGTTRRLDVTLLTDILKAGGNTVTPRLWTTPGVAPWRTNIASGAACGK